jgi:lysozyme
MKTSTNGLNFIARWEGCVLHVYKDIAGKNTIGVGHLVKPGETFPPDISRGQALDLLAQDVKLCEDAVDVAITVPLNQNQYDALISWSFNVGTGALKTSTLAQRLNAGHYDEVPQLLLVWCKARINGIVVEDKGLKNRRISEGQLWSSTSVDINPHGSDLTDDEREQIEAQIAISLARTAREAVDEAEAFASDTADTLRPPPTEVA